MLINLIYLWYDGENSRLGEMIMIQTGSFQWMKSLNKSIILNQIRTSGPISRAQIAKDTKLTPPTVSSIVKELIEQGLVKESNLGTSQGGRKPTMLVINSKEFYIIGIDAGPKEMEMILSDLSGQIIYETSYPITTSISEVEFMNMLKKGIEEFLETYAHLQKKVIGIGVAMHGVIDVESGTSLFAPNMNLRNIPIKQELEDTFSYVVKVENDARAMALGEAWFGDSETSKSMMAVNMGRGIGAGMVIDGKLYHGEYDTAGEIGHMTLDIHGKKCQCGNHGCLQTVASGPAIAEKVKESVESGEKSIITDMADDDISRINGELVYQAALENDYVCRTILEETGVYIGVGLTNLIHVMNPGKIVIGGGVAKAEKFILSPIKTTIAEKALTKKAKQTQVVISDLGERATSLGAVSLLLVELFDPQVATTK